VLVKLRVANGRHPGATYNVWRWPYLIGRHAGAGLRINNPRVSGRHCLLLLRGVEVWVRDSNSTGGTLVNDEPLASGGERRLSVGDRLTVGRWSSKWSSTRTPCPPSGSARRSASTRGPWSTPPPCPGRRSGKRPGA
jgi:predicted component of type VI protein secretion system